ncbi:MAG: hypothetical protein Mars2KO_34510 [Maribacter sp.]
MNDTQNRHTLKGKSNVVGKTAIAIVVLLMFNLVFGFGDAIQEWAAVSVAEKIGQNIACSDGGCEGIYTGPEFVNGADVAHQFSNAMAAKVGDHLKKHYDEGNYAKVDFSTISMSTKGMGSGTVEFKLSIPFVRVATKCEAFTSFDHVGGWNHEPALSRRKKELHPLLMKGHSLNISDLKTTPEGLQEYWIQWKHKKQQSACE